MAIKEGFSFLLLLDIFLLNLAVFLTVTSSNSCWVTQNDLSLNYRFIQVVGGTKHVNFSLECSFWLDFGVFGCPCFWNDEFSVHLEVWLRSFRTDWSQTAGSFTHRSQWFAEHEYRVFTLVMVNLVHWERIKILGNLYAQSQNPTCQNWAHYWTLYRLLSRAWAFILCTSTLLSVFLSLALYCTDSFHSLLSDSVLKV